RDARRVGDGSAECACPGRAQGSAGDRGHNNQRRPFHDRYRHAAAQGRSSRGCEGGPARQSYLAVDRRLHHWLRRRRCVRSPLRLARPGVAGRPCVARLGNGAAGQTAGTSFRRRRSVAESRVWKARSTARPLIASAGSLLSPTINGCKQQGTMTAIELVAAAVAAFLGGAVSALAGGGTLIAFPVLVAMGVPPLTANVTTTVALCPGYLGGALAERQA